MQQIVTAIKLLKQGKLVSFPTETVYGLGADAMNPAAVAKVYAAKARPSTRPLIVHIADYKEIPNWALDVPDYLMQLASKICPGPVTFILPKAKHVPDATTGGLDSIALRVPNHPVALKLLAEFQGGLVGPSANKYGSISPTSAADVVAELADKVDLVLDGGACEVGIESTILKVMPTELIVMRAGMLDLAKLQTLLPSGIKLTTKMHDDINVPGNVIKHYAPSTKTFLLSAEQIATLIQDKNHSYAVLGLGEKISAANVTWIAMPAVAKLYAKKLYASLRLADNLNCDKILITKPPVDSEWRAILDRVTRASYH